MGDPTSLDDLRAALHRDPRWVASAASTSASEAERAGDVARLSECLAVLGRARRSLGEIDLAEATLSRAVAAAEEAARPDLEADALVGLAGVLSFAGRSAEAFDLLDRAAAIGDERNRAFANLQRAVVAQRVGRMAEALVAYEEALPTLRRLGLGTDVALVLMNRGVVRTQSGELAEAIGDLEEAHDLFHAQGNEFGVAQALHGLGWALARQGEVAAALDHLDRSTAGFEALGHDGVEVLVDRCEVLVAAGLTAEAAELAATTAARLQAAGNRSQAAETLLLAAQALRVEGRRESAASAAARAAEMYEAQGSEGWRLAAELEVARSAPAPPDADSLERLAVALAGAGNASGAVSALAAATTRAALDGDAARSRRLAEQCATGAARLGLLSVRLDAAHARATALLATGDPDAALVAAEEGLTDLQHHAAGLAALDARAGVTVHARDLAAFGLRAGRASGDPLQVFRWIERTRWHHRPAPRPPTDSTAAQELEQLRAVVSELRRAEASGDDVAGLLVEQRRLERRLRDALLRKGLAAAASWEPAAPDRVMEALGDAALVELAEVGDVLVGVRLGSGGMQLLPAIDARMAGRLASDLAAALRAGQRRPGAAGEERLRAAAARLDELLRPALDGDGPLVLVGPSSLQAVPFGALASLAGRPVVLAPSAAWVAGTLGGTSQGSRAAVTVAGPRLALAEREALDVAACRPGSVALVGEHATGAALTAWFADASVVHVVTHARLRHDNPLWSSLELADGPLSLYDLGYVASAPEVVVLSACDAGSGVRAGDRLLGIASVLLDAGAGTVVAAVSPLADDPETVAAMVELHRRLAEGARAAAALADVVARHPSWSTWPLVAFGRP